MTRFILSFFGAIFTLLTLGVMMTALAIGGVFWMYGRDLPSHESLAQYTPPTISRIYSTEGRIIDEFAKERRLFTPAERDSRSGQAGVHLRRGQEFLQHQGYDIRGIAAAALDAVRSRGRDVRGASTITQQVMKNFLLSGDRRAERKIKEIILATRLEQTLSKDKILELYLNEIFLGQNSYGVTAAAQTYFNKSLTRAGAARGGVPRLAAQGTVGLPPGAAQGPPAGAAQLRAAGDVRERLHRRGHPTRPKSTLPLRSVQNGDFEPFQDSLPPRDYFTDEIRRQLSHDFGEEEFFTGGYSVRATLDPEMQVEAAKALRSALEEYDRGRASGAAPARPSRPSNSGREADWRAALSDVRVARDIDLDGVGIRPSCSRSAQRCRIGIEGVPEDEDGHGSRQGRAMGAQASAGRQAAAKARSPAIWSMSGDVVLVRRIRRMPTAVSSAGRCARCPRCRAASWRWT